MLQALKLEPKNAKNALLFSNLGLVQRRLGEFDKALESYSFALNFAGSQVHDKGLRIEIISYGMIALSLIHI